MIAEDSRAPFTVHFADRLAQGLEQLSAGEMALVILDLSLPDSFGLETFTKVYTHSPAVPIIVLTGNDDDALALSAVKGGAQDYLVKSRLDRELLLRSMHYSIERKRYQVQLEHQANYDALTGLPNRNLLHDRLRQTVYSQRNPRNVAVVFMDLDHFKFVNDSLGHSTGDKLLQAMGDRLPLEHALRRALERKEFMLHYQQKVDLRSGSIIGAEALVRWMHPEWGLVRPARFIPIAEETGLIVQLGEWVAYEAARQTRAWLDAGLKPGVVSVNLSARQFRAEGLVLAVSRILQETGLDPAQLEMELTESMVMHNVEAAIATLQGLKSLGISLSVDDFGTGYSSLSYLKDLPIDALKIDRSFVRDIRSGSEAEDGILAAALISLGHALHLKVIAQGVETDAQLHFLKRHGCDQVQGFLYGEPVPPEQFAQLLERAKRKGKKA